MYRPRRPPRSAFHELDDGLRCHVTRWGEPSPAPLVLLHGWMDAGATFQFVVDALARERYVIAPDWRGFGRSGHVPGGRYWFPDYLADLDALLDRYSPDRAVDVAGHSMGGNAAGLYAGARPERVRRLALLEGFGLPSADPGGAPVRYRRWLRQLRVRAPFRSYADYGEFADRLRRENPRLTRSRSAFVARCWGRPGADGRIVPRGDPAHRRVNPVLYRLEEAEACWRAIRCPVLWVWGDASAHVRRAAGDPDMDRRRACFRTLDEVTVTGAGHMLHHDRPEALARVLEAFLSGPAGGERTGCG
ncbi:MAG TPA: alpha/beta hydrolase [Gammaproteobacteria bacterium]|nr:alpha/beta hydrolase [Gammaproteobacteria bacterium]